jgi:hypothetical protein
MIQGKALDLPKINITQESIQNFRGVCKEVLLKGDQRKRQTFIKSFIKKIDLTKMNCKVYYDLARLLVAHQDGSSLRDSLVEAAGIEPAMKNSLILDIQDH